MSDRDLDLVVFGATGITGRQAARYLAGLGDDAGRWAAAGRDPQKVGRVLGELGVSAPETIAADVNDPGSLAAMASRARVVLNLVGPYTRFGAPVIEACVAAGSHYVDLTGEIPFVRRMIDRFHSAAVEAGVKVVEVCGLEALPPDLVVALAAERARERYGADLTEIELEMSTQGPPGLPRPSDIISGGTLQSSAEIIAAEGAEAMTDPAALIEDPLLAERVRAISPIAIAPRRSTGGAIVAPMAPGAYINPAVIHRSAALAADERGEEPVPFRYREGVRIGGGTVTLPLRYAAAGLLSGAQIAMGATARARPAARRRIAAAMRKALPSSGFGPSGERLEQWRWRQVARGRTAGGDTVEARFDADGQPGYLTTARAVAEAGLMLAEPGLTPERSGCLTPATAIGTAALERFERAGMRFQSA